MLQLEELKHLDPVYLREQLNILMMYILTDTDIPEDIQDEIAENWDFAPRRGHSDKTLVEDAESFITFLDDLDDEDAFGTEGWRHRYEFED